MISQNSIYQPVNKNVFYDSNLLFKNKDSR